MTRPRRRLERDGGKQGYRKLFVIAVEGAKTEREYFDVFKYHQLSIKLECLKGKNKSSPLQVLNRMKRHIIDNRLRPDDEAWLVVDKDRWTDEQLDELYKWTHTNQNYGLALSNPNFEYWLLLHFEDGTKQPPAKSRWV